MEKKIEVRRGMGTLKGNSFQEAMPVRYQIDIYRKVILTRGHPQLEETLGSRRLVGSIEMLGEWPKYAILLAFHNNEDLILTLEDGGEVTVNVTSHDGIGMSPHLPVTVTKYQD